MANNDTATASSEATPSKFFKPIPKDLSPHSMASEVLKEAMKEQEHAYSAPTRVTNAPPAKRRKHGTSTETADEDFDDLKQELEDTWTSVDNETMEVEEAVNATKNLVGTEIEGLIRAGLDAFHQLERTSRELELTKEELDSKSLELTRLLAAEEKNRSTITNLLHAVEASKTDARENSRTAVAEAGLRAELSFMLAKRDEAFGNAEESKRKATLLEEELRQVKTKLVRVTQDKIKMERDQRATLSLAKSLDSHVASDVDFYKRKVTELTSHVQGQNAVLAEKNRQVDEMRRQIERSMSQNRLANLRGESDKNRQRSH